jgi:hypothetical protein
LTDFGPAIFLFPGAPEARAAKGAARAAGAAKNDLREIVMTPPELVAARETFPGCLRLL